MRIFKLFPLLNDESRGFESRGNPSRTLMTEMESVSEKVGWTVLEAAASRSGFYRILSPWALKKMYYNKTGNIRVTWHSRTFAKPLFAWKNNKYYIFLRVVACVRSAVWACVRCACNPAHPTSKACGHILSFVAYLAPPHFSTFSHKKRDFREEKLLNIKCVLIFSTSA